MKFQWTLHRSFFTLFTVLVTLIAAGCGGDSSEAPPLPAGEEAEVETGDNQESEEGAEEQEPEEVTETVEEESIPADPIGKEIGEPVALDHETAIAIIKANITRHVDGLDEALTFVEDSNPINNFIELFSDDEEEDGDEPKEDEKFEIDLADLRDGIIEVLEERMMVESTVESIEDGMALLYTIDAAFFCDEEPEEDESEEQLNERLENMEKCAQRLEEVPLQLRAMSDGEEQLNVTLLVGAEAHDLGLIQIHGDSMAASLNMEHYPELMRVFIDPDDFEMPSTMTGTLACEVLDESDLAYSVRCGAPEGITATPSSTQETFGFNLPANEELFALELAGGASTLEGEALLGDLQIDLPWQWMVELFHDDEGMDVEVCDEPDPECDDCEPSCWMEYQEGPEAPEVDGTTTLMLAGPGGKLAYDNSDDTFRFTGLTLGSDDLMIQLDGEPLIQVALNAEDERTLDLSLKGTKKDILFEVSPKLDATLTVGAWDKVLDPLPDMWELKEEETLGWKLEGADTPTISILDVEEDTEIQVTAGTMTMWSSEMSGDVVIGEGQCMTSEDEENLTDEELEAQHPMFGGLMGQSCEQ